MSEIIKSDKQLHLTVGDNNDLEDIYTVAHALSSRDRLKILQLLIHKSMNIYTIAKMLKLPKSTVADHIAVLENAQILFISTQQGPKKHVKMCHKQINDLFISFCSPQKQDNAEPSHTIEMPVGLFSDIDIHPPCGMYIDLDGHEDNSIKFDSPLEFYHPRRNQAELLWFDHGTISYKFPNKFFKENFSALELSFEACSEIVYHKNDWPSDITVSINDIEILTFQSPGDFGGRRGRYSPEGWSVLSTQYGLLYKIMLNKDGVFLNDVLFSKKTIDLFDLSSAPFIKVSFSIKEDAVHRGGLNLFGRKFGDYDQSIVLTLYP